MFNRVGIVGVGLIGASIGLALKQRKLCKSVLGIGRRISSLDTAIQVGAVDEISLTLDDCLSEVDLLIVCTPVDLVASHVERALSFLPLRSLITDAGSTKANIVRRLEKVDGARRRFVGSHPLAGSEKSGPAAGRADLFVGRTCVITPTETSDRDAVWNIRHLWVSLGMRVVEQTPEEHDRMLGATSHLPHLVASALACTLNDSDRLFTGTGFRDTTRIAAGDPDVWRAIFMANRQALLEALAGFKSKISDFETALASSDQDRLKELLTDGKQRRDSLGT